MRKRRWYGSVAVSFDVRMAVLDGGQIRSARFGVEQAMAPQVFRGRIS